MRLGATHAPPHSLTRVQKRACRSCDPGQVCLLTCCYLCKHLACSQMLSILPVRLAGDDERKLTGTACLLLGCVRCVSQCVSFCSGDSSVWRDHPSSSCCLFCFPLFNCSGAGSGERTPVGASLTAGNRWSVSSRSLARPATPSRDLVGRAGASGAGVSHCSRVLSRGLFFRLLLDGFSSECTTSWAIESDFTK